MSADLPERVGRAEEAIQNLRERYDDLSNEVVALSKDLADTRTEMRRGFDELKDGLTKVTTAALDSMPKWAAEQSATSHKMIGALIALLGVAATLILVLAEWKVSH